jgi:hypothetical protein
VRLVHRGDIDPGIHSTGSFANVQKTRGTAPFSPNYSTCPVREHSRTLHLPRGMMRG